MLFFEKLKIFGFLMLKLIIAFLLINIFRIIFIDGILNDALAEYTYDIFPEFYAWAVYMKDTIALICVAIIFSIIIYRFISKKVNELNKIYNAIDNVYNDEFGNIELPNSLWMFSDKLNKIKYEYAVNKNKAKDAEQKKNDLIMYMAHDLKTPLTSVIGYLSLLNDEKNISKDLQEKYLRIALNKAMRVEELTNQFFEITRYNLQDMPINKNKIDLSLLLEQLIDESYPMMQKRNLKFNVTKPNNLIFIGDGDKLARAFGSLIKNAINYSYENTEIEIEMEEQEEKVRIVFRNKGDKIPEYKLEKLFEKFYRGDESRTSETGGNGLGLAIAKDIIVLHNGSINVKNDNEFIEFYIELVK